MSITMNIFINQVWCLKLVLVQGYKRILEANVMYYEVSDYFILCEKNLNLVLE